MKQHELLNPKFHGVLPLNPLKGTSVPEKTEINYGLFMPQKSPLGDLGVNKLIC